MPSQLLSHLLREDLDFDTATQEADAQPMMRVEDADPQEIFAAQVSTAQALTQLFSDEEDEIVVDEAQQRAAREAFQAITLDEPDSPKTRDKMLRIVTPPAVAHLVGMLTAYDWEFINQAQQLRGYAVAQIVQETQNPDPKIRLQALKMLGTVTEIGLFTEKVEVTRRAETVPEDLKERVRERLLSLLGDKGQKVQDAPIKESVAVETVVGGSA